MNTRCKFKCDSITKQKGWNGAEFVYDAKFSVVYGDTEENKKFFAATPSGQLSVGGILSDQFEVGKEYYIDISEANKGE